MPSIRPAFDLRNYSAEIARDMQSSEKHQYESNVYSKLLEAEIQSVETTERLSHEEVMAAVQSKLGLSTFREK